MIRELQQLYEITNQIQKIEIQLRHDTEDVDLFKLHQAQKYLGYFINETTGTEEFQKELNGEAVESN